MKILVFDDNKINRDAAQAQLKDHDLTVVGTYDEAQELLIGKVDSWKFEEFLGKGLSAKEAKEKATRRTHFDVVLSDLLVPASAQKQGPKGGKYVGEEMPVGIFIGLLAAIRAGAKYVAVFTDSDHHSHPASACFDAFNYSGESSPVAFTVEGSKVLLSNTRNWVRQFSARNLSKALGDEEKGKRSNTVHAKNWRALLEYLLKF